MKNVAYLDWMKDRLKSIRKEKGHKQSYVAKKIQVIEKTYCSYEQGLCEPPVSTVERLCRFYNISLDYFFQGSPIEQSTLKG